MLEITGLTVEYPGGARAVDGVTLSVNDGERVALIGANGAGKTTLMLAAVGVVPAAAGSVAVGGVTLGKRTAREIRAALGLVFQNPDDQLFMPTIYDDAAFGPRNLGLAHGEVDRRVQAALDELAIGHLAGRSPLKLSGGEKRLCAIAGVLAMEPSVLMFDEPTAFLDLKARRRLIAAVNGMAHAKLIASHDLAFLDETCDRAVLMRKGRLCADGPVGALIRDRALMEACELEAIDR